MELIDPKNIIFTFLLFFGGCISFRPPEPVEITTPKTVVTEKQVDDRGVLEIRIAKNGMVNMSFTDSDGKRKNLEIKTPDKEQIEKRIQEYLDWKGKSSKPDIIVIGDASAKYKSFNLVIEALRAKEIYNFKLVTTPE